MINKSKHIDQFGDPIPEDLVTMPDIQYLALPDIKIVDDAKWYDADGLILVSAKEIQYLSEDDPLDSGTDIDTVEEIIQISPANHMWNHEDGFYHT